MDPGEKIHKESNGVKPIIGISGKSIYTSLMPALLNNSPQIFAMRTAESMEELFYSQCRMFAEHLRIYLRPEILDLTDFNTFIKANGALGINFLKSNVAPTDEVMYFIGLQYLTNVAMFKRFYQNNIGKNIEQVNEDIRKFIEWNNGQLALIASRAFLFLRD